MQNDAPRFSRFHPPVGPISHISEHIPAFAVRKTLLQQPDKGRRVGGVGFDETSAGHGGTLPGCAALRQAREGNRRADGTGSDQSSRGPRAPFRAQTNGEEADFLRYPAPVIPTSSRPAAFSDAPDYWLQNRGPRLKRFRQNACPGLDPVACPGLDPGACPGLDPGWMPVLPSDTRKSKVFDQFGQLCDCLTCSTGPWRRWRRSGRASLRVGSQSARRR